MIKLLGAALIVASAASVGLRMAHNVRMEERCLRQLLRVLELMTCEIDGRLTPVQTLGEMAAGLCTGPLQAVFTAFSQHIALQDGADTGEMMEVALIRHGGALPLSCVCRLRELGGCLGAFDAPEQSRALEALAARVQSTLAELQQGKAERCRSYEVMGVCAGCALAIVLF